MFIPQLHIFCLKLTLEYPKSGVAIVKIISIKLLFSENRGTLFAIFSFIAELEFKCGGLLP